MLAFVRTYRSGAVLATLATLAVGLWLTPFTLHFLTPEEYGIFALGANVVVLLSLIDISIAAGINVHLARHVGQIDPLEISRCASSGFYVQLVFVALVLVGGITLASGFGTFFSVPAHLVSPAIQMLLIMTVGTSFSFGIRPFSSILIAHQLLYVDNLIRLVLIPVRTALTALLLLSGFGLLYMAIANLVATGVTALLAIIRAFKTVPGLRVTPRLVSWDIVKTSGATGIWFTLGGIAGTVIQSIDGIVAGRLVSLEAVTTLSITGRVYFLSQGLLYQLTDVARPGLGQLMGQAELDQAYKTYRQLFLLSQPGLP